MWWRFRRHRLALASVVVIGLFYAIALLCEFVAPHDPGAVNGLYKYVQPQGLSFFDADGRFSLRPGTHALTGSRDPVTRRLSYVPDDSVWYPIHFLLGATSTDSGACCGLTCICSGSDQTCRRTHPSTC
jgi:peptide/nickel transport system permease protein